MAVPFPPAVLLASIILSFLLNALFPLVPVAQYPWTLAGVLPIAAGLVMFSRALAALSAHETTTDPTGSPTRLATTGPYRICRNPIYLGFVLIALGVALFLGSLRRLPGRSGSSLS